MIAESTAGSTSQFIQDRVVEVVMITAEPAIVDAVMAGNRSYEGLPDSTIESKIEKIDKSWNTPASDPMVKQILVFRSFSPLAPPSRTGSKNSSSHRD